MSGHCLGRHFGDVGVGTVVETQSFGFWYLVHPSWLYFWGYPYHHFGDVGVGIGVVAVDGVAADAAVVHCPCDCFGHHFVDVVVVGHCPCDWFGHPEFVVVVGFGQWGWPLDVHFVYR